MCEDCGVAIQDQYIVCAPCSTKRKQNRTPENDPLLKAIGAVNNNLYFLRRALEIQLRETFKTSIVWDKTKKDFVEKKL